MNPLNRYIKYSAILHITLLVVFIIVTMVWSEQVKKRVTLVIIPKGTAPDAVLTQDVLDRMNNQDEDKQTAKPTATPEPETTELPSLTPTPKITATPEPVATETPKPTPTATPTPAHTPKITATPKKTPKPTPSPTPKKKETPKPTATPKKKSTPKPTPTPKPTLRPTKTPTPTVKSAYDIKQAEQDNDSAAPTAIKTPAGAKVQDTLSPGQKAGVPGLPTGIEGAPMPLDPKVMMNANPLSAQWAGQVRLKIQSNFTVAPSMGADGKTCEVEWQVLPDGSIQQIRVRKSSGIPQLDSAAMAAVQKTQRVEPLPTEMGTQPVWTSLIFEFGE